MKHLIAVMPHQGVAYSENQAQRLKLYKIYLNRGCHIFFPANPFSFKNIL